MVKREIMIGVVMGVSVVVIGSGLICAVSGFNGHYELVEKVKTADNYSKWQTVKTGVPNKRGEVSITTPIIQKSYVQGDLKVSKKKLQQYIGVKLGKHRAEGNATVTNTSSGLHKNMQYKIQVRQNYDQYNVTQQKYLTKWHHGKLRPIKMDRPVIIKIIKENYPEYRTIISDKK